jgi:hypothetical protein
VLSFQARERQEMSAIEVFTPRYTKSLGWPDFEACVAALPLCERLGATEIHVVMEGETHGRWYTVEDVKAKLRNDPGMKCLFGLGNVDPEHGLNWVPGRHLLY